MAGITEEGRKPRNIKTYNLKYVLSIFRSHDTCTASEISRESNLSVTTIIKIIDRLKECGLIKSLGKGVSTKEGGKKPEVFAFNKTYKYAALIYMRKAGVSCALTDLTSQTVCKSEALYKNEKDFCSCAEDAYQELKKLLADQGIEEKDLCGVCIGIDGIVNAQNGNVIYPIHNKTWPTGDSILVYFKSLLKDVSSVYIENSGRLIGQYALLKYPEIRKESAAVFTIAQTIAGVLFDKNEIVRGAHGLIGEIGHISIPDPKHSVQCECGKKNCFEKLVNTRMLPVYAKELAGSNGDQELVGQIENGTVGPMEIIAMADAGNPLCQKVIDIIADHCFFVIENIMITCDPHYYVLGGVYAENSKYFRYQLKKKLGEMQFFGVTTKINLRYINFGEYDLSGSTIRVIDAFLDNYKFD